MNLYPGQILALAPSFNTTNAIRSYAETPPARRVYGAAARAPRLAHIDIVGYMHLAKTELTTALVLDAADDETIDEGVIYVDSGGGEVSGVPELCAAIGYAAAKKPITAVVTGMGCSGALWAIAAASRLIATPSAVVGSVGCFSILVDSSAEAAALGLRIIPVTSSTLKIAGLPGVEVVDEQVAAVQRRVDRVATWFKGDLFRARKFTQRQAARALNGDVYLGGEAQELGLVDGLAPLGFDRAVDGIRASRVAAPPAEQLHGQAAADKVSALIDAAWAAADGDVEWIAIARGVLAKQPELARAARAAESWYVECADAGESPRSLRPSRNR